MASFSVSSSNGFTLTLTVTEGTPSTEYNNSPVTYSLALKNKSYNFDKYAIGYSVSIDGTVVASQVRSTTKQYSMMSDNMTLTLCSGSKTIAHKDDGSKSINVAFSIDMAKASYTPGPMSGTGSMALTTIPRATQPTLSPSSVTMGNTMTINLPRAASSFTHDVSYSFGNLSNVSIQTGVATSASWSVPLDLAKQIPNAPSGTGIITVVTKNNGSVIGTKTASFTAIVPDNESTKPECSFVISPANNPSWVSGYVQGKTKVSATLNESKFKFGTSLKSCNLYADGVLYISDSNTLESNKLSTSGNVLVKASVTDKRGFTSKAPEEYITVYPYSKPSIIKHPNYDAIVCQRCQEDGTFDSSGTRLFLRMRLKWSSLGAGENKASVYCVLKEVDGEEEYTITPTESGGGGAENNYSSWYDFNGVLGNIEVDVDKTYIATVTITDRYGEKDFLEFTIPTDKVTFHLGEEGDKVAFGKYAEHENTVEVAEDWELMLKGDVVNDFPISRTTSTISATDKRNESKWYITKHNSGLCELWARVRFKSVAVTGTWTNVYSGYIMDSNIPYPVTFKEMPICNVTPEHVGGNCWISTCDYKASSTTNSPMFQAIRPNASTIEVVLNYYVRGYI